MPFQRLLMAWFAAAAVGWLLQGLVTRLRRPPAAFIMAVVPLVVAFAVLVVFVRPAPFVPNEYHGLTDVSTTASRDYVDLQEAVRVADGLRPAGTSIFVIGNRDDWWHHQLWAPVATGTPIYYDDWMWYWTTTHRGPYDYRSGHYFPNPSLALTADYLQANGIGAVVVTDMWVAEGPAPREAARASDLFAPVGSYGAWDVYTVREPAALITIDGQIPSAISVADERLEATFDGGGEVVIRRNWFPRWEVLVNGEPVPIERRDDGYMQAYVDGPAVEAVNVVVRYRVTPVDWMARGASILGGIGVVVLAFGGRRWFSSTSPKSMPAGTINGMPADELPS
jgi:hypothetical protein